jgi:outer membrane protein
MILASILFMGIFVTAGTAQQSFDVAVVDLIKAFEISAAGQQVVDQLKNKEQEIRNEIAGIENEAQKLQTKYNTQKLTLTMDAQQQLLADIDRLRTKRSRIEEDRTKEFRDLQTRLFGKLRNDILPVVDNIAREKGFSLVLDVSSSGVVYFNQTIDITEEVIKRYDQLTKK